MHFPNHTWNLRPLLRPVHVACLFVLLAGAGAVRAQPVPVQAQPANPSPSSDQAVVLNPFEVSGQGDRGYGVTNSIGASRISTPIEDLSNSIEVINRQFMDDVGGDNLVDVAKYISGVTFQSGTLSQQITVRGSSSDGGGGIMVDGIPEESILISNKLVYDPFLFERIEVIKGPVGTLYGSGPLGGVVNQVSKSTLPVPQEEMDLSYGSWNQKRLSIDVNRPITTDNKLVIRLIADVRDGAYTYDNSKYNAINFKGMFSYSPTSDSQFWFRFTLMDDTRPIEGNEAYFADAGGTISFFLPADKILGDQDTEANIWYYGYETGYVNSFATGPINWNLRLIGRYNEDTQHQVSYLETAYDFVNSAGQTLGTNTTFDFSTPGWTTINYNRSRRNIYDHGKVSVYDLDLIGKTDIGPVNNQVLTYVQGGDDYYFGEESDAAYLGSNLFNRTYYYPYTAAGVTGPYVPVSNSQTWANWFAYGLSDNVYALKKRLIFAGAIRYDYINSMATSGLTGATSQGTNQAWSYKYGVVGKVASGVGIYYNYSQSFTPISTLDPTTGTKYPNEISEIHEVGVKLELCNSRIVGTIAGYNTTENNFLLLVHETGSGATIEEPTGLQTIHGAETDWDVQPIDSVTFHLSVEDMFEDTTSTGLHPRNVPLGISYKFFGKYTFLKGPLKGLAIGGGDIFTNRAAADSTDDFTMPAYSVSSAFVSYQFNRHWTLQLNVNNLNDEKYATGAVTKNEVYAGEPRNATFQLRTKW